MKYKKIIISLIFGCFYCLMTAQKTKLFIQSFNSRETISLNDIKTITIKDNRFVLHKKNENKLDYNISNIRYWGFENKVFTDIEQNEDNHPNIYPNPIENILYLESREIIGQINIYDITGNLIFKSFISEKYYSLDLSILPKGMYFLITKSYSNKIIKK